MSSSSPRHGDRTLVERRGMQWIPGGTFRMGADNAYPEERPVRQRR